MRSRPAYLLAITTLAALGAACGRNPVDTESETEVASVRLAASEYALHAIGAQVQLVATAEDSTGRELSGVTFAWSSSNERVATVNSSGLATAVGNGSSTITVKCGNASASGTLVVEQSVATVAVIPAPIAMRPGETLQLNASVTDANGYSIGGAAVTWSSTEDAVASVDADGLLSAVAPGTAAVAALEDEVGGATIVWVEPLDAGVRTVVVTGPNSSDARIVATREAVEYWNGIFAELGLRLPFATVRFFEHGIPEELLAAYSNHVLEGQPRPAVPNAFTTMAVDVVLALSHSAIISFATEPNGADRWLVGIRTDRVTPLSLPNVPRNLVAHELGHVLGLGHNSDPTKLMCGRPASCRPGAFQSAEPRFFELTDAELALLVQLHSGVVAWLGAEDRSPFPRAGITPLGSCRAPREGSSY